MKQKIAVTLSNLLKRNGEQKNVQSVVARKKRRNIENKLFI